MTTSSSPLVLVHGFAQSPASWDEVVALLPNDGEVRIPELPGHGATGLRRGDPTPDLARTILIEAIEDLDEAPVLWGYSLGARAVYDLLINRPELVRAAVIESGAPGIEDPVTRNRRREADWDLAAEIETGGIERFVERWERIPALGIQSEEAIARQREIRLAQEPLALAAALRGLGQAAYPSLWSNVRDIQAPVLLLTGADDALYETHADRLAALIGNARRVSIAGAGHAVHTTEPRAATNAVIDFIRSLH